MTTVANTNLLLDLNSIFVSANAWLLIRIFLLERNAIIKSNFIFNILLSLNSWRL